MPERPDEIARDPAHDIVLNAELPGAPWDAPHLARLPGTVPLDPDAWFVVDETFGAQMALRERLLDAHRGRVVGALETAHDAALELYDTVLAALAARADYEVADGGVCRPDGVRVVPRRAAPLESLGRLVAADLCLLQKPAGATEHVLTGAVLCFPSHWTLAEKLGLPVQRIHAPVPRYSEEVGRRVQRLFDALVPGRLLMRMNAMAAQEPWLFTPSRESEADYAMPAESPYLRSERQTLRKLPRTGAVVFSIETRMMRRDALPRAQGSAAQAYLTTHRRP